MMNKITTKNNKRKNASATMYVIFFFIMFLAFAAFAVDGAVVLTDRVKLQNITETSALAAASEFASGTDVATYATSIFNTLKTERLGYATSTVEVDTVKKRVRISSEYLSRPIFLAFLGVTGIKLEAKSCAASETFKVSANHSGISWVSASAQYSSDILADDSSIVAPIGGCKKASYDYANSSVKFELISSGGLSLGPGGYVTIRLPEPIVDKPGADLYIEEGGSAKEGYMVFAGLDVDPANPYVKNGSVGADINWVNISCSGTSKDIASPFGTANSNAPGSQVKFYGTGSFDLGASCSGSLSVAKYIRIVDDNEETAYIGGTKYPILGEASTATAGADLSTVSVLNHVRLMPPADYAN